MPAGYTDIIDKVRMELAMRLLRRTEGSVVTMTTFACNDCVFDSCDNCVYRVRPITAQEDARIRGIAPCKNGNQLCGACAHWRELSDEGTGRCVFPLPDSLIDNGTRVMGYWNGLECPCWKEKP
jgi:hypothetical protein